MTETPPHKRLVKARINLLIKQPFFGTLALFMQLIEDEHLPIPSMATDGERIYYDPGFVMGRTFQDLVFIFAHEIGHCVLMHGLRINGRDEERWNIACDYVVNALLRASGFGMPKDALYDAKFEGMNAEEVYQKLPKNIGGSSVKPLDRLMRPKGKPTLLEERWKTQIIQAANAAKGAGKMPGSLQRFVDEVLEVRTDWRSRLRQFATERTKDDYSFQYLNRKQLTMGNFLPGLHSESMGTMAVISDDSGSISNRILGIWGSEIASIRDAVRPQRTIVLSCDAAVNHVNDLGEWDEFKLESHGGGGTDFRPPFDWLEERGIRPACLVYLTDLEGRFPDQAPDFPVLWCSINKRAKAPWGETLYVDD